MAIRKYKPTTPGRRGASVSDFAEITRSEPEKSLVRPLHGHGGRNAHGRITTRHKGGGHKRAYRVIDFRRNDKDGVNAKVAHIEYDPNRTANIALLHYLVGDKRYIVAPQGLSQGDVVESGPNARCCELGADLSLRDDQQIDGVGQEPVLQAVECGRRLRAAEGEHDGGVVFADKDLGVAHADQPGVQRQIFAKGRGAGILREVGVVRC